MNLITRYSFFLYAKYDVYPYYTYYRMTFFTEEDDVDEETLDELRREFYEWAEEESVPKGWELSTSIKEEKEQVLPEESEPLGINVVEFGLSDGEKPEPGVPAERIAIRENDPRLGPTKRYNRTLDEFLESEEDDET